MRQWVYRLRFAPSRKWLGATTFSALLAVGLCIIYLGQAPDRGQGKPAEIEGPLALRSDQSLAETFKRWRGHAHEQEPVLDSTVAIRLRLDMALGPVVGTAMAADVARESTSRAAVSPAVLEVSGRNRPGIVRLDLLARVRELGEPIDGSEAFGAKSWLVVPPPPPPPPPSPPEKPRAPPLPFRYLGQINDGDGRVTYLLARGTSSLSVVAGDRIDNLYLFEGASSGALQFTFLPLKERQNLLTGAAP